MKPTFREMVQHYRDYILELRNGERAVIVWSTEERTLKIAEVYEIENDTKYVDVGVFNESAYIDDNSTFDIVKIYKAKTDREYLHHILNRYSELNWDWVAEEPVEEMTLSEVCKALGKNIKIVKE